MITLLIKKAANLTTTLIGALVVYIIFIALVNMTIIPHHNVKGDFFINDNNESFIKEMMESTTTEDTDKIITWTFLSDYKNIFGHNIFSSCIRINTWGENSNGKSEVIWYYLPREKYFIGYQKRTSLVVGYFGSNGFSEELNTVLLFNNISFLYRLSPNAQCIRSDNEVYLIQFGMKKIVSIKLDSNEKIMSVNMNYQNTNQNLLPVVIRTNKRIIRFDDQGKLLSDVILPINLRSVEQMSYSFNGNHLLSYQLGDAKSGINLYGKRLSSKGDLLWEAEKVMLEPQPAHQGGEINIIFMPFLPLITMHILNKIYDFEAKEADSNSAGQQDHILFYSLIALVILALCISFVHFHLKKRTGSKRLLYGWLLIIAVFSIPGVIAYLTLHRLDKTIECHFCHKQFSPINGFCLHCTKEIPAPALDGREIFDMNI